MNKPEGEFNYIDLSSVDKGTKRIGSVASIPCAGAPSRARQIVAAGDILISTVRPNLNGVAVVPLEFDGATASTGYTVLRPRDGVIGEMVSVTISQGADETLPHPKSVPTTIRVN